MDYISQLPDCVLSYILSMLSIKDRLKTKILCKRWSRLSALTRDLNFDVHNMLGGKEILEGLYMRSLFPNFDLCRDKFVNRVDQFLNNFQGTKIDSFLLNFYLHRGQSNIIDQWISFAIARGVGRIDLLLFGRSYFPHRLKIPAKRYKFPFALFQDSNASSTLNHLSLQHCIVSHPHPINCDFISLKNLRSLALEGAQVDQMFFTSLLSNCPLLEKLCLNQCKFKSSLPEIKIISLSLCHLEFRSCTVPEEDNIQMITIKNIFLDCLKLTSLRYCQQYLQTFHFNTPMLKNIDYFGGYDVVRIFAIFATFPELEILRLPISKPLELVATSLKITPLKHLTQLNIRICSDMIKGFEFSDVLWILTIIQASPLLQKFSAMVEHPEFLENQKDMKDIEKFSHDQVKVIELSGCVGNWYEAEFVMNVLKYAHRLERVVLSPYWREFDRGNWQSDPVWFQNGRERIIKKLQAEKVVGLAKLTLI